MKYLILIVFLLGGCSPPSQTKEQQSHPYERTSRYTSICIDGVQYWYKPTGHSAVMAPRYDATTRKVVTCP